MQGVTTILYIRHGETEGNNASDKATYTYTGCQTDRPLLKAGHDQAEQCAERLLKLQEERKIGKIDAIYSSKLIRAVETADKIAAKLGLKAVQKDGLQEINWGSADGQLVKEMSKLWKPTEKEVKAKYLDRKERWNHLPVFPASEKFNALLERSTKALSQLAKEHQGKTIVVVGHGRVLKTHIADALDKEEGIPYPANCGIAEFEHTLEGLKFKRVIEG